jgi:predicted methyltransferase
VDVDPAFADIPYLNGSLFNRIPAEERNPDYRITAEVLKKVIEFLDTFRFVSEGEAGEETIDPEILGYIFERAMTATDRKGTGAFYTPKYITQYICENTIYPYILEKSKEYLKEKKDYKDAELPKTFEDLLRLRSLTLSDIYADVVQRVTVLDPACGSGAFLYQAANTLLGIYKRIEERVDLKNPEFTLKKIILQNNIYGVDINPKAVEIAKLRMWLWIAESYDPDKKIEALPNIEYNIRCGNTLVGFVDISKLKEVRISLDDYMGLETPLDELIKTRDEILFEYKGASGDRAREMKKKIDEIDQKIKRRLDVLLFQEMQAKKIDISPEEFAKLNPFHWGFEFHKVFENGEGGFSVVVGNPPYVRQEAIKELKPILKEYYEVYHGVADLYAYFFERGHKILREGGHFGFISSNKFLQAAYGDALKSFLSKTAYPRTIPDFGDLPVFDDATTYPAIFITVKTDHRGPTRFAKIPSLDFNSLSEAIEKYGYDIPPEYMEGADWKLRVPEVQMIIEKMERNGLPLEQYVKGRVDRGVITGFDKAFVIDKETREKLIREHAKSVEIIKPFIKGEDVKKYEIDFKERYLIFSRRGIDIDEYPAIKRHLEQYKKQLMPKPEDWDNTRNGKWHGRKSGPYKWYEIQDTIAYWEEFENPKILYLKFQVKPAFYFDDSKMYSNSAVWLIPTNNQFLISILNSKVGWFLIQNYCTKIQNGYQLIWVYLKKIPIRRINFTTPEEERSRLVSELKEMYGQGRFEDILLRLETYLPKDCDGAVHTELERSDVVHDLLAFLAEQMIEMNKEKQREIKGFLGWLEDYLEVKVDEMNVKTKVREFYKEDVTWEDYYKVLKKSKNKSKVKIEGMEAHNTIKEAFESSRAKLDPLMERIKETDGLIDKIVYKLYGLTEEEIRVVEGSE